MELQALILAALIVKLRPSAINSFIIHIPRSSSIKPYYYTTPTQQKTLFYVAHSPSLFSLLHDAADSSSSSSSSSLLLQKLLSWFQGDFDNYNQVLIERQVFSMTPREGGGHEHIHCTLIPLNTTLLPQHMFQSTASFLDNSQKNAAPCRGAILAVYYLDGNPNRIFRIRIYTLFHDYQRPTEDKIRMKLFLLHPKLENRLRSCLNINDWDAILINYLALDHNLVSVSTSPSPPVTCDTFRPLQDCDLLWMHHPDPFRHGYLESLSYEHDNINKTSNCSLDVFKGIHAYMMYDSHSEGVLVESQTTPGLWIRVKDELSLWENNLWINDRGFQLNATQIYGNWKGIPYQLERVTSFRTQIDDMEKDTVKTVKTRKLIQPWLEWTLHSNPT